MAAIFVSATAASMTSDCTMAGAEKLSTNYQIAFEQRIKVVELHIVGCAMIAKVTWQTVAQDDKNLK
jgi:hypothetical protein